MLLCNLNNGCLIVIYEIFIFFKVMLESQIHKKPLKEYGYYKIEWIPRKYEFRFSTLYLIINLNHA